MLKTRVIPCLTLMGDGLVKTRRFKDPIYVGDPVNAIRIFNEKEVDELMLLDITASEENRNPNYELIKEIAEECFMPLSYGGGIRSLDDIQRILKIGVEKVSLNTAALDRPKLITDAVREFGSQSIVVSIDVRKTMFKGSQVVTSRGRTGTRKNPVTYAKEAQELGAGEILLNAVDRDGMMQGMDLELIRKVSATLSVPLVAVGGAGSLEHIKEAVAAGAHAVAAGSFFVFKGRHRAVLITYPQYKELQEILGNV